MKELLEAYVVEKLQLQQQLELLARLVTILNTETWDQVDLETVQAAEPAKIEIRDGEVYLG